MNRSTRLQPIVRLAAHREKEASIKLIRIQERLATHQKLLDELRDYHAVYTCADTPADSDVVRLQDFRLFIDRLEHAIARQQIQVANVRTEFEAQRDDWSNQRSHHRALDNVTARYTRHETQAAEREEQRLTDEISSLLRGRLGH